MAKVSIWAVLSKSQRYSKTNRSPGIITRRKRDATRSNTTRLSTSKLPNEAWLWFRWTKLTEGDTTAIWVVHCSVVTTLRWMLTDALRRTRAMTIRKSTPTGATSSRSTNRPWRPGRRNKHNVHPSKTIAISILTMFSNAIPTSDIKDQTLTLQHRIACPLPLVGYYNQLNELWYP